jgi:hypothetical protein
MTSSRQIQPSSRLRDFMTYTVQYPIQEYISYKNISQEYYTFFNLLLKIKEPHSYEIVKLDQEWCEAMDEELHALEKIEHEKYVCYQKTKKK